MGVYDELQPVLPVSWNARVDYERKHWTPFSADKYVVHWPGSSIDGSDVERLRAWEAYHMDSLGWLGIAYNYAIGQDGTLYYLRGENRSGATSGDYEQDGIPENHEAVAVLFILRVGEQPSQLMLDTFADMWRIRPLPVIGHKDVFLESGSGSNTRCPGEQLYPLLETKWWEQGDGMGYLDENLTEDELAWLVNMVKQHRDTFNMTPTSGGHAVELLREIASRSGLSAADETKLVDWLLNAPAEAAVNEITRRLVENI